MFSGNIVFRTTSGDISINKNNVDPITLFADIAIPETASHTFNIEYRNSLLVVLYTYHISPEICDALPPF